MNKDYFIEKYSYPVNRQYFMVEKLSGVSRLKNFANKNQNKIYITLSVVAVVAIVLGLVFGLKKSSDTRTTTGSGESGRNTHSVSPTPTPAPTPTPTPAPTITAQCLDANSITITTGTYVNGRYIQVGEPMTFHKALARGQSALWGSTTVYGGAQVHLYYINASANGTPSTNTSAQWVVSSAQAVVSPQGTSWNDYLQAFVDTGYPAYVLNFNSTTPPLTGKLYTITTSTQPSSSGTLFTFSCNT